jgi:hypothetical protein
MPRDLFRVTYIYEYKHPELEQSTYVTRSEGAHWKINVTVVVKVSRHWQSWLLLVRFENWLRIYVTCEHFNTLKPNAEWRHVEVSEPPSTPVLWSVEISR